MSQSSEAIILRATESAVKDLGRQVAEIRRQIQAKQSLKQSEEAVEPDQTPMGGLFACKINSGIFAVEWGKTRYVLEKCGVDMTVVAYEE